jgi:hypothetical protein
MREGATRALLRPAGTMQRRPTSWPRLESPAKPSPSGWASSFLSLSSA